MSLFESPVWKSNTHVESTGIMTASITHVIQIGCLAPSRIWLENATGRLEMTNNHCKRVLTCLVIISKTLRVI